MLIGLIGVVGCGDGGDAKPDAAPMNVDASVDAAVVVPTKEGQVMIGRVHEPDASSFAVAMFADGKLINPTASAGGCYTAPNTPSTSLAAGSIMVTGTLPGPITLAQDAAGDRYSVVGTIPDVLFAPGATLGVSAAGGTVPAFTGSVTAPAALPVVNFPATFSRANGGTITWPSGNGDRMLMLVLSTSLDAAMVCEAPDSGSFTLTPAALAIVPTMTEAFVTIYRLKETVVTAGAWKVYVRAADGVQSGDIAIGN
jgi:hypothetical protein